VTEKLQREFGKYQEERALGRVIREILEWNGAVILLETTVRKATHRQHSSMAFNRRFRALI
jgi:hypothetical protein